MATYWQEKAQENKGDMFLGILATKEIGENGTNYLYREKIPEPLLHFCDWFVTTTKIKPTGQTYKGWIKAFNYCVEAEYSLEDLENAWYHSGEGEAFTVTSPFSLLGVAGERKARAERRNTKYDPTQSKYYCDVCNHLPCVCDD